eukprot:6618984-Lingulodinium_polyedra.AAC.1
MECTNCEMRGAAAMECVSKRMSEQLLRENCSETRWGMNSTAADPHTWQRARSMRQPPYGGRRMERANCDTRGAAIVEC